MSEDTNAAKAPKSSLLTVIGAAVAALAAGGGVMWVALQRGHATAGTTATEVSSAARYTVHLEGFTVNLADAEETHFLRVTIELGLDHSPQGNDREKPGTGLPIARMRDAILSVLTACKADALLTAEGKAQLKKNLLEALNRSVPEAGVREVYFTEFLVQR
jgi:flagellar protein FliL